MIVRVSILTIWCFFVGAVIVYSRPDLLRPGDLGTDASNYIAAGDRLIEGHPIYSLSVGDRPAPADNPPEWTVPIVSPPTIAALMAPFAWLPGLLAFYLPWAIGVAGTVASGWFLLSTAPLLGSLLTLPLLPRLAVTAWSGNLNAWLLPLLILTFTGTRQDVSRFRAETLGLLIGVLAAVKLGPILIVVWLLAQGRRRAAIAAVTGAAVLTGATFLAAPPATFRAYLEVADSAAASPAPLSIPGLAQAAGMPDLIIRFALYGALAATVLVLVALRRRPALTFRLAVVMTLVATPVVRPETLALSVAALVAWRHSDTIARLGLLASPSFAMGLGVLCATTAITASFAAGAPANSTMSITNDTDQSVVVRFAPPGQSASFGFMVPARSSGQAWATERGGVVGLAYVLAMDCTVLDRVTIGPPTSRILVTPTRIILSSQVSTSTAALAFSADCASVVAAERRVPR